MEQKLALPRTETFSGSEIPKLTAEGDAALIYLVMFGSEGVIEQEQIHRLNYLTERSSNERQHTYDGNSVERRMRRDRIASYEQAFYDELGWIDPDHPIHDNLANIVKLQNGRWPTSYNVVANIRLLYAETASQTLPILQKRSNIFTLAPANFTERLRMANNAHIDTARVLLLAPYTLTRSKLSDMEGECQRVISQDNVRRQRLGHKQAKLATAKTVRVQRSATPSVAQPLELPPIDAATATTEFTKRVAVDLRKKNIATPLQHELAQYMEVDVEPLVDAMARMPRASADMLATLRNQAKYQYENTEDIMTLRQLLFGIQRGVES